ncbi:MAG: transposase [Clostridiales bacterium]|jgi:REP element-mobilizing transposase RayT|nr:transposase [Clostridiales bacterium]
MKLLKRKPNRLKGYDYSKNGAYFITICTYNREILFGNVGEDSISSRMIDVTFNQTIEEYSESICEKYIIMPNHFHAIIFIGQAESAHTISEIVQAFKRHSTVEYIKLVKQGVLPPFEKRIWQRSFHDHIIRNEQKYQEIWEYIDKNALKWEEDCFYKKQ